MTSDDFKTRQDKRAEKRRRARARMKKHGKTLGRVYLDALKKRKKTKINEPAAAH